MGVIFSLSGCKAVGKTTLIDGLRKCFPEMIIREGFRQVDLHLNLDNEEEYYENERVYIEREVKEYHNYKNHKGPVLLLRGPEDLELFATRYPLIKGKKWDVEVGLKNELSNLRKCRSDYILYLYASISTIMHRKNNDRTKPRKNMSMWLDEWQPNIEEFMKSINYTTVLETDEMTVIEVLNWTTKWMISRM